MVDTNLEYNELVRLLKSSDPKEVYEELVGKEKNILDTINRVIDFSNEKEIKSKEFTNMSLNEIIHKFYWNFQLMWRELYNVKTLQDLNKLFTKEDRPIYIGLFLVLISIFLFFIMISK
jgi:hypothetical protein